MKERPSVGSTQGSTGAAQSQPSLSEVLGGLIDDLRGTLHSRAQLFSLEAKRAALALGQMAALGAVAVILSLTAWLMVVAGIVAALIAFGLAWPFAMLAAIAANLIGAWLLVKRIRVLANFIFFEATLRHINPTGGVSKPLVAAGLPVEEKLDVQ